MPHYIGVDIAKNWINVFDPETTTAHRISTRPKQLEKSARTLAKTDQVDAKALAHVGAALRLSPTRTPIKPVQSRQIRWHGARTSRR